MSQPAPRTSVLQRLRFISHVLDNAIPIPGTRHRIGLDPVIGLLPGGGDTIGAFLSVYIVLESARLGVPRATLLRMAWNIIADALLGLIPFVGDLTDVAWKANSRNLALLEHHLASSQNSHVVDRLFLVWLTIFLLMALIGISVLAIYIVGWLFRSLIG